MTSINKIKTATTNNVCQEFKPIAVCCSQKDGGSVTKGGNPPAVLYIRNSYIYFYFSFFSTKKQNKIQTLKNTKYAHKIYKMYT